MIILLKTFTCFLQLPVGFCIYPLYSPADKCYKTYTLMNKLVLVMFNFQIKYIMDQEDESLLIRRENEFCVKKNSSGLNDLKCNVLFNFLPHVISKALRN